MDEPWEILGTKHRIYRHDPYATPRKAEILFGEFADDACLDHILLDWRESPKRFEFKFKPYRKPINRLGATLQSGATSVQLRTQPTDKLDRGRTNWQAGENSSLYNSFKKLKELFLELNELFPQTNTIVKKANKQQTQMPSKDSWGTKAQDLFNIFVLLKTIKYFLPG